MKSEFYIINLIQGDVDARRKVARYFGLDGSLEARELIAQLSSKSLFRTQSESVFEDVREVLENTLLPSTSLSDADLRLLLQAKSQKAIAKLLNCSPSESVQTLFPPDDLAEILQDVGVQRPSGTGTIWDDSEYLLSSILDKKAKLQAAGITDLFGELSSRLRINVDRELAQKLGCHEDDVLEELIRSLKATPDTSKSAPRLVGGVDYDIFAISRLRAYLHDFRERLVREAILEGGRAESRLPGHRAPGLMVGLIEYCFGGNYKSGLNHLLSPRQFLRERTTEKLTESSATAGILNVAVGPVERLDGLPEKVQRETPAATQVVRVEIHYRSSANAKPLPVLAINDMTGDEAEQVGHHLEKSCEKLSPIGANLYEKILNTSLPIFSRWRRTLYAIIKNHSGADELADSFVQCFVLAGVSFDAASLVPGLRPPQSDTAMNAPRTRLEFPKGPREIVMLLEEEYRAARRSVSRIGGAGRHAG
jgi:hypothetical protein